MVSTLGMSVCPYKYPCFTGDARKHNSLFLETNPTEPKFGYKQLQKEEEQARQAKKKTVLTSAVRCLLPPGRMLVCRRVTTSIKFAGTHLYTWVERGSVRVKCLAQEQNTMSPARARTRSARSRVKRANHEATAPPTS